jgi:capsular polysaccharide transport system ATP-binding protein
MTGPSALAVIDGEPKVPASAPAVPARGHAPRRSLRVERLTKDYHTHIGVRRVLEGISFELREGEKIAVLGRNGSGKSTLVKMIGGVEAPTSGVIERGLSMSWPLGFAGGVTGYMSGAASARFIARLYNRDERDVLDFVDDFAELGKQLYLPLDAYSSGMRSRLMFALTLAIDFECLLIDEVLAVGDQRFHAKCHDALFGRRVDRAMILVSHDTNIVRNYCRSALVLKAGRGRVFEDLELALSIYATL